jgi:hypothetical protein
MAIIDVTNLFYSDVHRYDDMLDWIELEIGPHIKKGNNYTICIFETATRTIDRVIGLGWHMDYITDEDTTHRLLTIYDELKALILKLTFCST